MQSKKECLEKITAVLGGELDGCILNQDCLEIMKDMPDGCVDAVVTDPPYGMAFRSNYRLDKHKDIAGDADPRLLEWVCSIQVNHSRYVFCRWDNLLSHLQPKSCITWVKNNWSMGDLLHEHARQTELILFWPGDDHGWAQGRPKDVVYSARSGNNNHPTEKPVDLMLQVIKWTKGVILDPFCGSGTTCVAAKKLGRRYIGIELDPKYAEIARQRVKSTPKPLFDMDDVKAEQHSQLFTLADH